jgi:hypothetical protein
MAIGCRLAFMQMQPLQHGSKVNQVIGEKSPGAVLSLGRRKRRHISIVDDVMKGRRERPICGPTISPFFTHGRRTASNSIPLIRA